MPVRWPRPFNMQLEAIHVGSSDPPALAPLNWPTDGVHWPMRTYSRFVSAAGLRWHVQQLGAGPSLLLVHGTGASTHSWRALAPLLAQRFTVTAFDLPGHGFTEGTPQGGMSLTAMSAAVAQLLLTLKVSRPFAVGHSAGAAVLCRMALDGHAVARHIVSLNGALLPFHRLQRALFAPVARLLAATPLAARAVAWSARERGAVLRLLAGTGSRLDATGVDLYWRLMRSQSHVQGALRMMAQWNIETLERELPRLAVPLTLLVGEGDLMVPPAQAERVQQLLPQAALVRLPRLGHLAHEEQPEQIAALILALADRPQPGESP
jgi:magnesium chelatase accessory protein